MNFKEDNKYYIQSRFNNAILEEKQRLIKEGIEVPNVTISVKDYSNRIPWKPEKKYVKFYRGYLNEIKDSYGLNISEMGIIHTLSDYIGYENNLLCKKNGDPILKKDLCEILDLQHNAVDKHMKTLVSKGIFAKVKIKTSVNYYIDPRIAYRGNHIDRTLKKMFKIKF